MTPITFLAPLGIEARAIRRGARGATVERIGMGPARATAARERLDRVLPVDTPLVMLGLGGGLVPGRRAGAVIVANSIQLLDAEDEVALSGAGALADALAAAGLSVELAPIVSSPRILHGADARELAGARGALAVDMESYWCAPLARTRPFAVCRVLSDVPGQELVSLRTPPALVRALRTIVVAARTLHHAAATTVDARSVQEADL